MRIGVDVGGTFTDLALMTDGQLSVHKVLSTPADPGEAVLQAAAATGASMADVEVFAHGTTVTTNAVIQRRGARTGLLTTRGFRDVLQIRRTTRGALYDFQWQPPAELVPRALRREVLERTDAAGVVAVPPDLSGAVAEAQLLMERGVRSLAVCFINSYANGQNERAVRQALRQVLPDLPVFISSEILPEWREFERTSTTVVSAYIGPVLTDYLRRLVTGLRQRGYRYDLLIMLANGGLATADAALTRPAFTIGSGPAAGVLAQLAVALASDAGRSGGPSMSNIIGMDIGGTSTDISLIQRGSPYLRSDFELEFGTPVSYPVIEINSIGAGGGTIAWVDQGRMLHVGPQSAGADPGPACMQRGGTEPTVTDAHVLLHRLNPHHLLDGEIPLSEEAAMAAVAAVASRLGMDPVAMADGILTLTVSNIVFAIRQHTIERGLDPREFVLVAYGGAGPLHAAEVAAELGITTALVPPHPGVTSALGLLLTDMRHDLVATFLQPAAETTAEDVSATYAELAENARARLAEQGVPDDRIRVDHAMDLRFVGQTHELTMNLLGPYDTSTHAALSRMFGELHQRVFGHAPEPEEPVEIVNLRVAGIGRLDRPQLPEISPGRGLQPRESRPVFFAGRWIDTPVYRREDLGRGDWLEGPAIVEQLDSTTVIPPGWTAEPDRIGSLVLRQT